MQARARAFVALFLCGCTCGGAPSAPSAAPTVAPAPSVMPPATSTAPPVATLTPAQASENARWLREARRATEAHDYPAALERFDRILARSPNAPRLQCEAGYVAHLGGHDADAARRLDLGLRLFGPDTRLRETDRVPVARCTFNRGIVYEAAGETAAARGLYQRSITLRPSDIVSARLSALGEAGAPSETTERTVADVPVRASHDLLFVRTHDAAALDRVVTTWVIGVDPADGDEIPGHRALPGVEATEDTARVFAWELDDGLPPITTERMVFAFERTEGFVVLANEVGGWRATDNGQNGGGGLTGTPSGRIENGMLRYEFAVTESASETDEYAWEGHDDVCCYSDVVEPTLETSHVTLCSLSQPLACSDFVVGTARISAPGSSRITCVDDDGNDVEGPPDAPPVPEPYLGTGTALTRVSAIDATHVRVLDTSGARDLPWGEAAHLGAWLSAPPQQ